MTLNKKTFRELILSELERYLQNTVWAKVQKIKERAKELVKIHDTFINLVEGKLSAEDVAFRLFEYERSILRINDKI